MRHMLIPVALMVSSCVCNVKALPKPVEPVEAPVAAPIDAEACFSPDEACELKLLEAIDTATVALDVAIYSLTDPGIADALVAKSKLIPVRLVADKSQALGRHSLISYLQANGVAVRFGKQRGIMHDKFLIIDHCLLETGSFNYTRSAITANQENQIYIKAPAVIERYQERFDKMWEKAKP